MKVLLTLVFPQIGHIYVEGIDTHSGIIGIRYT